MEKFDSLGDRLKHVEQLEAGRKCDNIKPLMARLDGRAFHSFTRGLKRPYDDRLIGLMIATTCYLVEQTNARLGYTQSDEISLYWALDVTAIPNAEYIFDGKFQKLTSILASMATGFFVKNLAFYLPEKKDAIPAFDCRVWNVDDSHEVYLNFLWRQDDAIKNSISMAAQAHFSHNSLHTVNSEQKKQMLRDIGSPWELMPLSFRMGTFIGRVKREVDLPQDQLLKIPEKYRPTGPVVRSFTEDLEVGYLRDEKSRYQELFGFTQL